MTTTSAESVNPFRQLLTDQEVENIIAATTRGYGEESEVNDKTLAHVLNWAAQIRAKVFLVNMIASGKADCWVGESGDVMVKIDPKALMNV